MPRGRVRRGPGPNGCATPAQPRGPLPGGEEACWRARRAPHVVAARPLCPPPRGAAGGPDTTPMAAAPGPVWSGAAAPPPLPSAKERCAGVEREERLRDGVSVAVRLRAAGPRPESGSSVGSLQRCPARWLTIKLLNGWEHVVSFHLKARNER